VEDNRKKARAINFASSMVSEIGGLAASYAQAQAIQGQAGHSMTLAKINSRFASMESRDILKNADKRAQDNDKNINRMIGAQKASFAGGNILVGDGTSAQIENQTREIGFEEKRNIKNNAWKQAFGVRTQAQAGMLAAENAQREADFRARNTLIAGGLSAAGGIAGGISSFQGGGFDPGDYGKGSK